ncbi:MAG TPA: DinB family protein [Microscillaceae bacterium]|nr:DinB family protein [Microscillaceae bacterium]
MNKEIQRIRFSFKMAYNGSPWHGKSLLQLVKGIDYQQANHRPIPQAHSIWELIQHILSWREFVIKKLEGDAEFDIEINSTHDWTPTQTPIEAKWQNILSALVENQQVILEILESWQDAQLDDLVPGKEYNFYTLLHGIIEHDIYHAGQIALVRKALELERV